MARNIHLRYHITGTLTARTPLHVGGYGDSPDTDMPLARNGHNQWYVPGTSLAGVLRAWCHRLFDERVTEVLWGFQDKEAYNAKSPRASARATERLWTMQPPDVTGQASLIVVEDALVQMPEGADIEIRDGVGLDRIWGTAAEQIKYDRAILPRDSWLPLQCTLDIPGRYRNRKDEAKSETCQAFTARLQRTQAALGHLLKALQGHELTLGAARTRGLGRVVCKLEPVRMQQLDSRDGILAALQGCRGTVVSIEALCGADPDTRPAPQPRLTLTLRWRPCGPLMVKAGMDGVGVDMLPLVSAGQHGVSLALPGSSIKGALRSQAERIVRTLLGQRAPTAETGRQQFLHQMEAVPLVLEVFGSRAQTPNAQTLNAQAPPPGPLPGLGALAAEDCYAQDSMDAKGWRAVTIAEAPPDTSYEQQELTKVLKTLKRLANGAGDVSGRYRVTHHVAIDRWTGGAADGMLFSVLAPEDIAWHDMQLHLDLTRLPKPQHLPSVMLLLLVLRDLLQRRLPLGFATNRGMGEIEVMACTITGTDLENTDLAALTQVQITEPSLSSLDTTLRTRLTQDWHAWLAAQETITQEEGVV